MSATKIAKTVIVSLAIGVVFRIATDKPLREKLLEAWQRERFYLWDN